MEARVVERWTGSREPGFDSCRKAPMFIFTSLFQQQLQQHSRFGPLREGRHSTEVAIVLLTQLPVSSQHCVDHGQYERSKPSLAKTSQQQRPELSTTKNHIFFIDILFVWINYNWKSVIRWLHGWLELLRPRMVRWPLELANLDWKSHSIRVRLSWEEQRGESLMCLDPKDPLMWNHLLILFLLLLLSRGGPSLGSGWKARPLRVCFTK